MGKHRTGVAKAEKAPRIHVLANYRGKVNLFFVDYEISITKFITWYEINHVSGNFVNLQIKYKTIGKLLKDWEITNFSAGSDPTLVNKFKREIRNFKVKEILK